MENKNLNYSNINFDYTNFANLFRDVTLKYQDALSYLIRDLGQMNQHKIFSGEDLFKIGIDFYSQAVSKPENWFNMQMKFSQKLAELISSSLVNTDSNEGKEIYKAPPKDKRFMHKDWNDNQYFNFLKQFYLMTGEIWNEYVESNIRDIPNAGLIKFFNRQIINSLSPSNFAFTNPLVINTSIEENYQNILKGLDNFVADLKQYGDFIKLSITDDSFFKLGKNIATTKGKVVFQNSLLQLICYEGKEKTHKVPILIVPAWINKYYILDLSTHNSFVKWLVDNNFQVFMVSWVNPDESYRDIKFEDYCTKGLIEAINFLQNELKFQEINAIGYCLGGTLLAMTIAYLNAIGNKVITSASFLTTLLDFENSGELGLFANEDMVKRIEQEMADVGYLDGRYLSLLFSMLKANELIWYYVVNNYLLGKSPEAFDILYWNSDPTNLPATMHSYYLRNMYLENNLKIPGKLNIAGIPIDLSTIKTPSFFLGAKDDHIAPAKGVFDSYKLFTNSPKKFCLTSSGHVAGVVNPPATSKYSYWSLDNPTNISYEDWSNLAGKSEGSWWLFWLDWLTKYSGKQLENNIYNKLPSIEYAPGNYVQKKL
ncbi:MAG: alpha/beta fold hydrolase [Rickettsiaceae bacterium]|nr:alpha/beta fold hydrolase [Rickettsiaceae bacterium]